MKHLLSLAIVAAASALAYVIANKVTAEEDTDTQLANPVTVVSEKEFSEAGITLSLPEEAVNVFWMTIKAIPLLYSLNFFVGKSECNLRLQKSSNLRNLSGMYFPWTKEETVTDEGTRAVIQTSSDEAGIALWYRNGYSISLSMKNDVSVEKLDEMFRFFNGSMSI